MNARDVRVALEARPTGQSAAQVKAAVYSPDPAACRQTSGLACSPRNPVAIT